MIEEQKKIAGQAAVDDYVKSGMVLGLGHGSTAIHALHRIAEKLKSGELTDIVGVPCSKHVEQEALELGIPLTTLEENPILDLTIDGADEFDPDLNLIKGGGGAMTREKIVAQSSKMEVIVCDESKSVPKLGTGWAVPVEVLSFGIASTRRFLEEAGATLSFRKASDGTDFITDQGNLILDSNFGPIEDVYALNQLLKSRAGIVEHGLFVDIASVVIMATTEGIQKFER
ncbi:MAG: ribose-5-phosphate isomerase RpiA [Anaerolineales bacterium]|nr:ribose-5-phosphate isomerase RpiA [Anaerolineales bacterium]